MASDKESDKLVARSKARKEYAKQQGWDLKEDGDDTGRSGQGPHQEDTEGL